MSSEVINMVSVIGFVASAVWTVSKIKSTTAVLNANIEHLGKDIQSLTNVVSGQDEKVTDHEKRIIIIEQKQMSA